MDEEVKRKIKEDWARRTANCKTYCWASLRPWWECDCGGQKELEEKEENDRYK